MHRLIITFSAAACLSFYQCIPFPDAAINLGGGISDTSSFGGGYGGGAGGGYGGGAGGGYGGAAGGGYGGGAGGGYGGGAGGGYGGSYGASDDSGYHHGEEHHEAKPYAFGYAVKDLKKGTDFNQHETSDGHNVHGQYMVQLPDGRTQIVSYKADWKNGYNAEIKYVGEAHHPEVYGHGGFTGYEGGSSGGAGYSGSSGGGYGSGHGGASSTNFQSLGEGSSRGYGSSSSGLESLGGSYGSGGAY